MVGPAGSFLLLADETSPHAWVEASASELREAVRACDFPIIVWNLPAATVRLANEGAEEMLGLPLSDLLGRRATDFFSPRAAVEQSFAAQSSGAVDFVQARREVRLPGGEFGSVYLWARVVDLDGTSAAVTVFVPPAEAGRLGRHPTKPWRDLAPIVVGSADSEWRITRLSADIADLVGRDATQLLGTSLLDLIQPDDVRWVRSVAAPKATGNAHRPVHLSHANGASVGACLIAATTRDHGSTSIAFALVGVPPHQDVQAADRVERLLLHLRRIGAEVRAAGVLDEVPTLPSAADHPQLGELTARQWNILNRLLKGQRVPAMAKELFVSQSTIRNHLATIFRKFGVHSQADLIELLNGARRPS